jgi:hypothetical protein
MSLRERANLRKRRTRLRQGDFQIITVVRSPYLVFDAQGVMRLVQLR